MHRYCSLAVTSGIHIYRQPGFELDRNPVIVDCDLLDHSADEYLAVFRLAGLFLDETDHGFDPVNLVLSDRRLRQNVLPSFAEGYYLFADFLNVGFVPAGIEKVHLALADHIVDDLDFLIDVASDHALNVLLQNRNDVVPAGVGHVHGGHYRGVKVFLRHCPRGTLLSGCKPADAPPYHGLLVPDVPYGHP